MTFDLCTNIMDNMSRLIVGKRDVMELLLVGLLSEGHVLLEDVPGLGKTLMSKALAKSIGGTFKRVQFTPDLLPADITGFNIYNQQSCQFSLQSGPVMSHVLLADEINRTIPRTQSCLLESMEERQVTIDGKTIPLPQPFFVMATQNPIEQEGTFPLPEAQLDRFLLRVRLGYPSRNEEIMLLERYQKQDSSVELQSVVSPEQITDLQNARKQIHVSALVQEYITDLVRATRNDKTLRLGVSPRGSLGLMRAGQGLAILQNRDYVLPDDIKRLAIPVLAHRMTLKKEEWLRGSRVENILKNIIEQLPVPTMGQRV